MIRVIVLGQSLNSRRCHGATAVVKRCRFQPITMHDPCSEEAGLQLILRVRLAPQLFRSKASKQIHFDVSRVTLKNIFHTTMIMQQRAETDSLPSAPVPGSHSREQRNYDITHDDLLNIHTLTVMLCSRHEAMTNGDSKRTTTPWPPPTRFVRRYISPHQSPPGPQTVAHYKDQFPQGPHDTASAD
jgi:hypothetical protein